MDNNNTPSTTVTVSFRFSKETRDAMAFIAWLSHRSMAQVIREYVKEKAADLRDENPEAAKLFDESNE